MSSSDGRRPARRHAALVALLLLAACGFRPLYGEMGESGAVAGRLAAVEVAIIPDRSGQILRTYLLQRLNPRGEPAAPAYRLDVGLVERQEQLGIRQDETATRVNLVVTAPFTLTDLGSGEVVLRDRAGVITSFGLLLDEFATLNAERDARQRSLRQISDDIRRQLALFFAREPAA